MLCNASLITVRWCAEQLQDILEPPRLVAERHWHGGGHSPALQERRVKRRRAAHREVHPSPEVRRRLSGEVRRRLRQPQRLHCMHALHSPHKQAIDDNNKLINPWFCLSKTACTFNQKTKIAGLAIYLLTKKIWQM